MIRLCCLSLVVALASDFSVNSQEKDSPKKFTNSLGMEFALVPKGKSWLGGGNGKEGTKEVTVPQDFYLGVYEVTQEEWEKIMGTNPSSYSRKGDRKDKVKDIPDAELKRFPVDSISWVEAKEFVKRLNEKVAQDPKELGWVYRLPTQQQWEYACRGGPLTDKAQSAFDYYFEKPSKTLSKEQANFNEDLGRPSKVGSYAPNRLGLYDMHGNVWELCDDQVDLKKGKPDPVYRGGSWNDTAERCRAACVRAGAPSYRRNNLGLRLARVPSTGRMDE